MSRRPTRIGPLLVAVLALLSAPAAAPALGGAASSLKLTPLQSVQFPDRAYVLTTPKPTSLDAASVRIRENGQQIDGISVVPAKLAAGRTFGVILLIDASNSMRGSAIEGAMAAARAFTVHRNPSQALGVITFNDRVRVVLRPTTSANTIDEALASTPRLMEGTRLYDATAQGVELLRSEKIKAGSLIALTDGNDIGSRLSVHNVTERAGDARVRVFTVGLRSPQFTPRVLKEIAEATGAAYVEAEAPAALTAIYDSLSLQLANEYVLRYRSLVGPDAPVRVEASVTGIPGSAAATYRSPALPATAVGPFHRSFLDRFWTSPASPFLIGLIAALLIAFAVHTVLRLRRGTLTTRVGEFVSVHDADGETQKSVRTQERFLSHSALALERALERVPWWDRFKEELEIGKFPIEPVPLVAGTVAVTVIAAVVLGVALPALFALFALAVPFAVHSWYKRKLEERRDAFAEQLPDNLSVLAASLRVGHSFVAATSAVVEEAEEPSKSELRRALSDEQLGVPVEEALLGVARRMANTDLEQVALVASLQRDAGGNTAEILDTVVDTIRERFEVRRHVKSLTAQGRLSRWILTSLPIAVALLLAVINPGYLGVLFTTTAGQVLLALGIGLLITGSFVIKRILDIEI